MPETAAHPLNPAGLPLARLPRRLAAIGYDSLLLASVLLAATALALGLVIAIIGSEAFKAHNPLPGNPFFQTWLFLVCFFFYSGFWVCGGQTLGMRAWRLRIQKPNGQGIGWQQALLRFLTAGLWLAPAAYAHQVFKVGVTVSLGVGFGGLLLLLALRLPDRASDSELVVLPKKP